jgi:hypothetical protein
VPPTSQAIDRPYPNYLTPFDLSIYAHFEAPRIGGYQEFADGLRRCHLFMGAAVMSHTDHFVIFDTKLNRAKIADGPMSQFPAPLKGRGIVRQHWNTKYAALRASMSGNPKSTSPDCADIARIRNMDEAGHYSSLRLSSLFASRPRLAKPSRINISSWALTLRISSAARRSTASSTSGFTRMRKGRFPGLAMAQP